MKLINLKLENFKGVKNLNLNLDGKNCNIYGENATGKTTIIDAWLWLLFDKDSENKKDFGVKTIVNGEIMHGLDHSVEATIMVNNQPLKLQKVFKEKWTKKRGSAEKEFSGHTTDFFLNEVTVKKKDFDLKIKEIAPEDIFRLLSDIKHFNNNLRWNQRRDILIEICGDITDKEVIESKEELKPLFKILDVRAVEEHVLIAKSKRKKINEELEKIPVRIDEVYKSISEITDINQDKVNSEIKALEIEIEKLKEKKIDILNGGDVVETRKKIAEIETKIIEAKNEYKKIIANKKEPLIAEETTAKEALVQKNEELSSIEYQIKTKNATMNNLLHERQQLLNNWHNENNKIFEFNNICPTCGQDLPEDRKVSALSTFNKNKSDKLENIQIEGKKIKEKIEILEKEINVLSEKKKDIEKEVETLRVIHLEKQKIRYSYVEEPFQDDKYREEIKDLNSKIENSKKNNNEIIAEIANEIDEKNKIIKDLKSLIHLSNQKEQGQKRIEELSQQERNLAEEFANLEKELFLCEDFIREKVNLLEKKINVKFKYARFKLFNNLINGGLEECCETLYNNIPYSDLNNAARLNVGLDIINTLSRHYGFNCPVFVDNSESCNNVLNTENQQILLYVSKDKELRIEKI